MKTSMHLLFPSITRDHLRPSCVVLLLSHFPGLLTGFFFFCWVLRIKLSSSCLKLFTDQSQEQEKSHHFHDVTGTLSHQSQHEFGSWTATVTSHRARITMRDSLKSGSTPHNGELEVMGRPPKIGDTLNELRLNTFMTSVLAWVIFSTYVLRVVRKHTELSLPMSCMVHAY